ncbi:hypothetical protein [Chondrinema litorale]|uniref:hypothetical protein n=1 Tax=Chondrinema litorale TaxID=2994555 RepID=UPI0025428F39|nr:hypothetical protein [Chondrinema litorale]UZR92333.1 hypothetical protein OQ292_10715 [Chondrinema litorale]
MKKQSQFIRLLFTGVFAVMVLSSPLLANALQLIEQTEHQQYITKEVKDNADDDENQNDKNTCRIEQSVVISVGTTSFVPFQPVKGIIFNYVLPVLLTNEGAFYQTAFTPSLLCFIKNILLFFSAPHAP